MADRNHAAEMKLPAGMTCADCVHGQTCDKLFGAVRRGFTSCDWWPSRWLMQRCAHERRNDMEKHEKRDGD